MEPNVPKISCSAFGFGRKKVSEIRTKRSDFGHFRSLELYLNRTESLCLKSERVQTSDVYCSSEYTMLGKFIFVI